MIQILKVLELGLDRQKKLIGNINDVTPYTVLNNSTNVLRKRPLGLSVIDGIHFIGKEAKDYTCRDIETMQENINPAFYTRVVIERVTVKVAELRGISL